MQNSWARLEAEGALLRGLQCGITVLQARLLRTLYHLTPSPPHIPLYVSTSFLAPLTQPLLTLPPSLPPPQARQADACLRVARLGVLTAANLCEDLLVTWRARSITHPLTTHPLTTHPRMTHPIITPQHPPSTHYQDTHCQPHTSR